MTPMQFEKREDGWWITGKDCDEGVGPYPTQAECKAGIIGLKRFDKNVNSRSFFTADTREPKEEV